MVFGRETTGGARRRGNGAVPAAEYPQTPGGVIRRIELGRDAYDLENNPASEGQRSYARQEDIQRLGSRASLPSRANDHTRVDKEDEE